MSANPLSHMPIPLMEDHEWDALYRFNSGADDCDFNENEWQTTPIPNGLSAEAVYRLLPSAPTLEFGGYLTDSQIHFVECNELSANTISSNLCTFHTHPTEVADTEPDLPSNKDIYSFLKWRQQRAITVGKELIWIFDKTMETLSLIHI